MFKINYLKQQNKKEKSGLHREIPMDQIQNFIKKIPFTLTNDQNQAIEEIGKTGGFVYIMDTTAGIPYISKTLSVDVTEQLKKKLGVK